MITLITGPIHSGKTTRLMDEYRRCENGDGFASVKLMNDDIVIGFDLIRLSSGERIPLARRKSELPSKWDESCSLGPYSFSGEAVSVVSTGVDLMIKSGVGTIFLDEIGSLELEGLCFHETVVKIADSGIDAVLVVRDTNLQEVVAKYGFADIEIVETGERFV